MNLAPACLIGSLLAPSAALAAGVVDMEELRVPLALRPPLHLSLRHLPPADGKPAAEGRLALFVHGATFPSALAAGFRFDGRSWMDDLSEAGFDVWALDFLGYGASDRYPEMSEPPNAHPALGRAEEASHQIEEAVHFIAKRRGVRRISLVAHSWGTIPAALYATWEPERIDRLVLFGPVAPRAGSASSELPGLAHHVVTAEDQEKRFYGYVPRGEAPVLLRRHLEPWGRAYLASDPTSATRTPPSVKVPYGPIADLDSTWGGGSFPYDPGRILAPTLIVRGEWDSVTTDADARWLFARLRSAPVRRDVVIGRGTHVMHLEEGRYQLYREVETFLLGHDTPETSRPAAVKR